MSLVPKQKVRELFTTIRLLVEGMATQAMVAGRKEYEELQKQLRCTLREIIHSEDTVQHAETALRLLREYNAGFVVTVRGVTAALPKMVSQMTAALQSVCDANEKMLREFEGLRKRAVDASGLSELHVLRAELEGCLDVARISGLNQCAAVNEQISTLIREWKEILRRTESASLLRMPVEETPRIYDPVTGLPGRVQAETALAGLARHKYGHIAVFDLDRLPLLRQRYGCRGWDQVLQQFSHDLAQAVREPDCLFLWDDGVLLAAIPESTPLAETYLLRSLRHFAMSRHYCSVEAAGRVAMVPITCRYKFWNVDGVQPLQLVTEIDAFVGGLAERSVAAAAHASA